MFAFTNRAFGPYWWAYWTMVTCNVISPQLFWFKKTTNHTVDDCFGLHLREYRDVVREVRDCGDQFVKRLSAECLGVLLAHLGGLVDVDWIVWFVLHTCSCLFCRLMPVINMAETKATLAKQYHVSNDGDH